MLLDFHSNHLYKHSQSQKDAQGPNPLTTLSVPQLAGTNSVNMKSGILVISKAVVSPGLQPL